MRVNLPYTLAALKSLTAAKVKAVYDALAAALNGNLTRDNFSDRAAIGVANKAAPRAWLMLDGALHAFAQGDGGYGDPTAANSGPSVIRWKIPEKAPSSRRAAMALASWCVTIGAVDNAAGSLSGGRVGLRLTPVATGVTVLFDFVDIPAGSAGATEWRSGIRALAETALFPGDVLEVQFYGITYNAPATKLGGACAALWLKMTHLP